MIEHSRAANPCQTIRRHVEKLRDLHVGTSHPRSNNRPVSAGAQVVTASGGGAIRCEIDEEFPADVQAGSSWAEKTGTIRVTTDRVELIVSGKSVAVLVPNDAVFKLERCLARGYRYVGLVSDGDSVHVWNEP